MPQGWHVVGSRGSEDIVNGRWIPVMEVTVQTDDGTENRFRIPTAQYNEANVNNVVGEWYTRHISVMNL